MDEWTLIAWGAFGVSALASLAPLGNWLLRADPQAIANAGRWSLLGFGVAAAAALLWLAASGRWTLAMMLAAFMMPVLAQGASRWRALPGRLRGWVSRRPAARAARRRAAPPDVSDTRRVEEAAAVLRAFLEQTGRRERAGAGALRPPMPAAEALEVLGLAPDAPPEAVREAHRRLRRLVDPTRGGTGWLARRIEEARDVLTETRQPVRSEAAPEDF